MRHYGRLIILSILIVAVYVLAVTCYATWSLNAYEDYIGVALDQLNSFFDAFWDFLVVNKFCVWLMFFSGRPSSVIINEASINALVLMQNPSVEALFVVLSYILELTAGPMIAIVLFMAMSIISYKLYDLLLSKIFNN